MMKTPGQRAIEIAKARIDLYVEERGHVPAKLPMTLIEYSMILTELDAQTKDGVKDNKIHNVYGSEPVIVMDNLIE